MAITFMYADVSTQDKKKKKKTLIGRQKYTLWKQDKILANYTESLLSLRIGECRIFAFFKPRKLPFYLFC